MNCTYSYLNNEPNISIVGLCSEGSMKFVWSIYCPQPITHLDQLLTAQHILQLVCNLDVWLLFHTCPNKPDQVHKPEIDTNGLFTRYVKNTLRV